MKNLNDKSKKRFTILGLSVLCVALTAGIYLSTQNPKVQDNLQQPSDKIVDVTPNEITDNPSVAVVDNIKPIQTPTEQPPTSEITNNIDLTAIEEKPQPPEKPDTAVDTEKPHDVPTEKTLTDPTKKPDSTPVTPKPTVPAVDTPKCGDTNSKGEIYIDGFGWVKNEGGGGQGEKSQLDPEHTDFDKIIGN